MGELAFDDEASSRIEGLYRIEDAARRRRIVRAAVGAVSGERILDVGCGPGFYCAELAEEVGPSGAVVGVDGSAAMLALGQRRCAGIGNVEFREGDAVSLPVADAGFDAALCVQVLEYVADPATALGEMFRALRPGGRVVLWDVDWATVSIHSEDPVLTERVLRAWDQHLVHRSLPRTLAARIRSAGFVDVQMAAHPFATIHFDPETYGTALLPFVAAFVVGRDGIREREAEAWVDEQQRLGERGEFFFTSTQFCFTATKTV